jgi:hypothetical protein
MSKKILLLSLVLLVASCGGAPAAIRYYVIDPVSTEPVASLEDRSVQILDIRLPQYLERFQIASRQSSNQLTFSDNHQWGENLRKNLYRTMTRNLSDALGTADVGSSISRSMSKPDFLVRVSLEAFEQGADGRVQIAARYQVSGKDGEVLATEKFIRQVDRDSGDNYRQMVSDLQTLFGELCVAVSNSIQEAAHDG